MIRQGWPYFDGWPFPERWVHLDGLAIHYLDEGSGARPVVMVHGNSAWSYMWRRLVPAITGSGHRALAFDLMGFGKSDKPNPNLHDFPHHARIVSGYIESLELSNLVMDDAAFENQKAMNKMQLDNQKENVEMLKETEKEIAGIQSAKSIQNMIAQV